MADNKQSKAKQRAALGLTDKDAPKSKRTKSLAGQRKRYTVENSLPVALATIKKHGLLTIRDLISLLPFSEDTFNKLFPSGSEQHFEIIKAIDNAKVVAKGRLRAQWQKVGAAAPLQLAAYKLMATEDEREALNTTYNKNEQSGALDLNAKIVINTVDSPDAPKLANNEEDVDDAPASE